MSRGGESRHVNKLKIKKMKTKRNLSARWFASAKKSRIYENGIWIYTTDENLSGCTSGDVAYFLRVGNYWIR